jgi:hypothetical protein
MERDSIQITISYEIIDCDCGVLVAVFVDEEIYSLLPLTEEELDRLCN